jgi:methyl-accepting chemotaxis protein
MTAIDPQSGSSGVVQASDHKMALEKKQVPRVQTPWWMWKLVAIFSLLALGAIASNAIILADVSSEITRKNSIVAAQAKGDQPGDPSHDVSVLYAYRNQMVALLGITIACFGAIIYLFLRKVAAPLNAVAYAAKEISRGNLTVTVPSPRRQEVGELGQLVNEVAANFQEILLLTGTTVGNANSALNRMEELMKSQSGLDCEGPLQEHVRAIKQDLETLSDVVKNFEFYETRFDGYKVTPRLGNKSDGT